MLEYEGNDYEYSITVGVGGAKALVLEEKLTARGGNQRLFYTNMLDEELQNIPTYFATGKQGKGQYFELSRNTSILYQSKILQLKKKEITDITTDLGKQLSGIFVLETSYLKKIPEKDILHIWTECVGKFHTDAMLYCEEAWQGDARCIVDARGMSDGTLRFLSIMVALLTNETNKLIVVEEVDNGLHPSRVHVLMNMLKELGDKKIDILVTTHNPALLDAAGTVMIPFITVAHRDDRGQSHLKLLEDIQELPKMISTGNIGELVTAGKIEAALAREG